MGMIFSVNKDVLIPRPDTEILVEEVINILKPAGVDIIRPHYILDLCTGSGAIGISIAKYAENAKVLCTDISEKALEVAKQNAKKLIGDKVNFVQSDLFNSIEGQFDLIVSNPPYIEKEEMECLDTEVKKEPILALYGGTDGLDFYRKIIAEAHKYLKPEGHLCLEIGYNQKDSVIELIEQSENYTKIYSKKDLAGNNRIIVGVKRLGIPVKTAHLRPSSKEILMPFLAELREELLSLKMWDNSSNLKQEEQIARLHIREAFIRSGFMNEPEKEYHLEILFKSVNKAEELQSMLESFGITSKITNKANDFMVYMKGGEEISSFLALIGANNGVIKFEEVRVVKDTRNTINRIVNCETANLNKTIDAALQQVEDIQFLKSKGVFKKLKENLKEIAELRLKHTDLSYEELGKMLAKPISKSGVSHRLKQISKIAEEYKQ